MRAAAVALAAALLLSAAGCGSTERTAASGPLGQDAATLVPPDALAFVSVQANVDSDQWKAIESATGALSMLRKSLRQHELDFDRDVRPALGDELNLALLGVQNGKPEAIALTQPKDEAKLRALAAKFDTGDEHYTVERIGDWSVVADSSKAFDEVRRAESGRSLADTEGFQAAKTSVGGDALATAYADGATLQQLSGPLAAVVRVAGSPRWVAAKVAADGGAVRLEVQSGSPKPAPAVYRPQLLRDVPAGAVLAVSFKDLDRPLAKLAADPAVRGSLRGVERYLGLPLDQLGPALRGEGAFYVLPGPLLPIFAFEVQSPTPQAAVTALQAAAKKIRAKTGNALPLRVVRYSSRVVLTDAPVTFRTSGRSLVNAQPFKDALAAADVPSEVTWLAYADVQRLLPIIQAISAVVGGSAQQSHRSSLERLGTVVAFGASSGSNSRLVLRLTTAR